MKICENCRAELNDEAIFCSKCGTKASETKPLEEKTIETEPIKIHPSAGETNTHKKSKKNAFIIGGVVVAVLILALLIVLLTKPQTPVVETVTIPDIEKLDVDTAKTLLANKGLIPKVEYEFNNYYDAGLVIRTVPEIGSNVEKDTPVTIYICKGPSYYELPSSLAAIYDIDGIEEFVSWTDAEDGWGTKGHTKVWVENGYLYITMYIGCISKYDIEFYGDFGDASINDTFDKTVPIDVIYDSKKIDNTGKRTYFDFKIPLSDLGVQKPTNINIRYYLRVNGERKTGYAYFDLTWGQ